MELVSSPASDYSLPDLVKALNRGFEEYFIPIHFTNDLFSSMLRKDGIDLADSRVLLADNRVSGVALIACRRPLRTSRVAAMGIAKEVRGKGAGSWFMKTLVDDAGDRGDQELVLEVIEQNEPAVKLYQKYGFTAVRRLVGYMHKDKEVDEKKDNKLQEIALYKMSRLISQYGLPELPWQLTGESISQIQPPPLAFRNGPAYVVISNPEAENVVIWSLLVEPQALGNGWGTSMLRRVRVQYPGKTWHVPAIFPEEMGPVFERAGFEKEKLSQWQMKLTL